MKELDLVIIIANFGYNKIVIQFGLYTNNFYSDLV